MDKYPGKSSFRPAHLCLTERPKGCIMVCRRCYMAQKMLHLLTVAVLALVASGCSVTMSGGRMYTFGVTERVTVTNNTGYDGDLERGGMPVATLSVGQSVNVPLGISRNTLLTFKAFEVEGGQRVYIGLAERSFQSSGHIGATKSWVIQTVRRPQRRR